jgi:hypothetical protein
MHAGLNWGLVRSLTPNVAPNVAANLTPDQAPGLTCSQLNRSQLAGSYILISRRCPPRSIAPVPLAEMPTAFREPSPPSGPRWC